MVGTIDWTPDVTLEKNGEYFLDMKDTGLEEFTLFIEGITEEGQLIYVKKDYSSKLNNQNQ